MLNKKEILKVKVDFKRGCVILPNGKERPLYVCGSGVWFRYRLKPVILTETNCVIL